MPKHTAVVCGSRRGALAVRVEFPMLISKRDAVRRTAMWLSASVLNGGVGSRLLKRNRSGRG